MKATDFLCCALRFHLGFFAGSFLGSLVFGRVLFQPVRSYVSFNTTLSMMFAAGLCLSRSNVNMRSIDIDILHYFTPFFISSCASCKLRTRVYFTFRV